MPTVLMVNTVSGGSHGRIMRDIKTEAVKAGFSVRMAAGRDVVDGVEKIGSRRDVLAHVALTRLLDRHALGSRRATEAFIGTIREIKPDLVHLHNAHGYYLHAQAFFSFLKKEGIPLVWTLHDCWALTGHCSHFVRANCSRWKTGCYQCPLKKEYPASIFLDASRNNYRWKREVFTEQSGMTVVTPSVWLSHVVGESFLAAAPRQVIPNGVDLSLFVPPKHDSETMAVRARLGVLPEQKMLLAVAAPFDARKGFRDALAVSQTLGDSVRLVMVGLTAKQVAALPANITGIERTDGPEALVALYGAADCLINPTYEDTYPTVNMEAMASGTPVAAYGVCGCTEQLESPIGVAVPVGNPKALAQAAMTLAAQKPQVAALCREYAVRHFDRQRAARTYVALYQRILGVE